MKTATSQVVAAAAACLMIATISALSLTGRWPGGASFARYEPNGIVDLPPEQVRRVEIAEHGDLIVWQRTSEAWTAKAAGPDNAVGNHIETALRFLNVSAPLRVLGTGEFSDADIAEFGLDPPHQMIALVAADGNVTSVWFGALNPAQTSHYTRVVGRSAIYLMPRHVAAEWQLAADMTRRHAPIGAAGESGFRLRLLCSCRYRWLRSGQSRSWPPAICSGSNATGRGTGFITSDSTSTSAAPTRISPIHNRQD